MSSNGKVPFSWMGFSLAFELRQKITQVSRSSKCATSWPRLCFPGQVGFWRRGGVVKWDVYGTLGGWAPRTWIPWFAMVHGDRFRPRNGVVGPLPYMAFVWLIYGGHSLLTKWDDPPSTPLKFNSKSFEKLPKPNRKGLSSNYYFSGTSC